MGSVLVSGLVLSLGSLRFPVKVLAPVEKTIEKTS